MLNGLYKVPKFLMISNLSVQFLSACMQFRQEDRPKWQDVAKCAYVQEIQLQDGNYEEQDGKGKKFREIYTNACLDRQRVGCQYSIVLK